MIHQRRHQRFPPRSRRWRPVEEPRIVHERLRHRRSPSFDRARYPSDPHQDTQCSGIDIQRPKRLNSKGMGISFVRIDYKTNGLTWFAIGGQAPPLESTTYCKRQTPCRSHPRKIVSWARSFLREILQSVQIGRKDTFRQPSLVSSRC